MPPTWHAFVVAAVKVTTEHDWGALPSRTPPCRSLCHAVGLHHHRGRVQRADVAGQRVEEEVRVD